MDKPALPPPPVSELGLGPELFNFTPQQQKLLVALMKQTAATLLSFKFNDESADLLRVKITQHAYCTGAMDSIQELLSYDARALQQFEASMRAKEQATAGNAPEHQPEF